MCAAVACGVGAVLFGTAGWIVVRPQDPMGPLSMLVHVAGSEHGFKLQFALTLKLMAIAAVTSVAAAALVGKRVQEAGAFAVAFGILTLTLATSGMRALLTSFHAPGMTVEAQSVLYHKLVLESFCWFGVILVGLILTRVVERWVATRADNEAEPSGTKPQSPPKAPDPGPDAPAGGRFREDDLVLGLLASGVAAIGAAVVLTITCKSNEKGQICFSLFASFFAGSVLAYRICRTRLGLWYCLSVLIVAVGAYVWAGRPDPRPFDLLTLPPIALARPLPAEYMSWGIAGAIAGFWFVRRDDRAPEEKQKPV